MIHSDGNGPGSRLASLLPEDFWTLKVDGERLLRITLAMVLSTAVFASGYLLYVGTFQRHDWCFSVIEETSGKNLVTLAGLWLVGVLALACKLRFTRSSEFYWRRLGTYALVSIAGVVFFLVLAA